MFIFLLNASFFLAILWLQFPLAQRPVIVHALGVNHVPAGGGRATFLGCRGEQLRVPDHN